MKYASEYKCRICGELLRGKPQEAETKELFGKMQDNVKNGKSTPYWVHICKDGSIGFCDYQGIKAVND
jgi:hypothetical protein